LTKTAATSNISDDTDLYSNRWIHRLEHNNKQKSLKQIFFSASNI
jgi:hypothetical protein